jgi:ligand-binding sensor domain-containing protein/signal transduction histidine kinase
MDEVRNDQNMPIKELAAGLCGLLLLFLSSASGQQLSLRRYGVAQGLAHNSVHCIYQDSKGYIWVGTSEGLSRFDGYQFTNYTTRDGLEHNSVNDITEDPGGRLWIATSKGVARFIDYNDDQVAKAPKKLRVFAVGNSTESNKVSVLRCDAENRIWCGTHEGLYRGDVGPDGQTHFEFVARGGDPTWDNHAFADRQNRLWFGLQKDLLDVNEGRVTAHPLPAEVSYEEIASISEDNQGRLLVANLTSVYQYRGAGDPRGEWLRLPITFTIHGQSIHAMLCDGTGTLWIGTSAGLIEYKAGTQRLYTTTQGLPNNFITALCFDREGNLWIGTESGGLCKYSAQPIISYTQTEGMPEDFVVKTIEGADGTIYATTLNRGVARIEDDRVVPILGSEIPLYGALNTMILGDRTGDWWVGSNEGLVRLRGKSLQFKTPQRFTAADGLLDEKLYLGPGLYEDPNGVIWVGSINGHLYWYDPKQKAVPMFQHYILPANLRGRHMMMDQGGKLWVASNDEIARLVNGEFLFFKSTDGLPTTQSRAFFMDSRGWLWIALHRQGVAVVKDPAAEQPQFINYSTADGLASDLVWSVCEDNFGRMYFATGRGLDQFEVTTGRIRHFTTRDGLAGDIASHCFKDSRGNIWICTSNGLSKFNPALETTATSEPPIYISKVFIAGEDQKLPETGLVQLPALELSPGKNNLLIEFVALSFQSENDLLYQYKLEGADTDWRQPSAERSVNYANLAPGSYRFQARAINRDGMVSRTPASFDFTILPPIWQRWWFLTLTAIALGGLIYALYLYRLQQAVKLERVRMRIAHDLHDDIGSSLSQVSILSEVVRQRVNAEDEAVSNPLSMISRISTEAVDSMSDIVWAINPQKDRLRDLTRRMRQFAGEVFTARDIAFRFEVPESGADLKLELDTRRQIFLIFKEAVNNVARHARCSFAEIHFFVDGGELVLEVHDDGKGFQVTEDGDGNGLISMRKRAESLQARLRIISEKGKGTIVVLRVPLARGWGKRGG